MKQMISHCNLGTVYIKTITNASPVGLQVQRSGELRVSVHVKLYINDNFIEEDYSLIVTIPLEPQQ